MNTDKGVTVKQSVKMWMVIDLKRFLFQLNVFVFVQHNVNLKSYLSNPSRIFKIDAVEGVLWLVKRVYAFFTHLVHGFL